MVTFEMLSGMQGFRRLPNHRNFLFERQHLPGLRERHPVDKLHGNVGFTFDLAYLRWVLCFVKSPEDVIKGLAAVVKPGGRVAIQDYFNYEFSIKIAPRRATFEKAIDANTRLVFTESIGNPKNNVDDFEGIATVAHAHGTKVVVDNTFATPYLQRPLELGADLVVHSMTKYLGGHSDVVGGAIIGKDKELGAQLAYLQNAIGGIQGPMDSFLVLRGIKTLPIRMDRHAQNAEKIVAFLEKQKNVKRLIYPFHESHPQVQIAKRQMKNGGGMISFIMKDGKDAAVKVAESTKIFTLAESLGGVESLIEVPAAMTHLSVVGSALEVDPGLVRLSVGIENIDDLLADLEQALK